MNAIRPESVVLRELPVPQRDGSTRPAASAIPDSERVPQHRESLIVDDFKGDRSSGKRDLDWRWQSCRDREPERLRSRSPEDSGWTDTDGNAIKFTEWKAHG